MEEKQVWPYVLPFPLEAEKRRLIWSILQSKVGMSIFMRLRVEGRTYQKDLIRETPYSNKTIIKYLKRMVSAGVLKKGMEQTSIKRGRVWVRWYKPTRLGRWFILFLKPPEAVPTDLARKTVEELFQLYASSIVEVCEKYRISLNSFHQILNGQHTEKSSRNIRKET